MVVVLSQSRWPHCLTTGVNSLGGESVGWTIRKVVHPCRSNRLVDNPEVEETTMNLPTYAKIVKSSLELQIYKEMIGKKIIKTTFSRLTIIYGFIVHN